MRESLLKKSEDMYNNFLALDKAFPFEYNLSKHFIAMIFANKNNANQDIDGIKTMIKYIKEQTGWTSPFRGTLLFMLSALLVNKYDNPGDQFNQMLQNHGELKAVGFKNSSYMPIAGYTFLVANQSEPLQTEMRIHAQKAFEIYLNMKSNHPWLTSGDDYPLAILLAKSEHSIDQVENYYKGLNARGLYKGSGLQLLSHILSFSEEPVEAIVDRCMGIHQTFKDHKFTIQPTFYSALGMLSILQDENGELLNEALELTKHLTLQKKYKWLGKGMNILLASAMVADEWIDDAKLKNSQNQIIETAMSISIETIIAAQTAATVAAISASTAAAASAST